MSRGFYTILITQFFSALGDNALLFAAIALLNSRSAPAWQTPVLQQCFVVAFILLAPGVGLLADAVPKGRMLLMSNGIKILGCASMLLGFNPLLAYAVVGIGSALYSPAKYGILTEYLPTAKLVWGNAWLEGLTVLAVILGAVVGSFLVSPRIGLALQAALPHSGGVDAAPLFAIAVILGIYLIAACCNAYIPPLPVAQPWRARSLRFLLTDFYRCCRLLWQDRLGRVSLAVTALFWGAGTTLRFIILAWAATALQLDAEHGTQLTAVVAVGLALGAVVASRYVPLHRAVRVLPLGVVMGVAVIGMVLIDDWRLALPVLVLIGALAGSFLIPMNALLQHRGQQMMGSGHSIAVQNFNENLCILAMLGAYALMIHVGWPVQAMAAAFGLVLVLVMGWLAHQHRHAQG